MFIMVRAGGDKKIVTTATKMMMMGLRRKLLMTDDLTKGAERASLFTFGLHCNCTA